MLKFIVIFYLVFLNLFANEEYFLTLRNDKVNLRLGPSFDYPIKIVYKKKHLPVIIKDRSDNFRRIQDHENNSGWIHISQLSKKKSGIAIEDEVLYKRPTIYSKPLAKIETGRLLLISKCKDEWCKAKTDDYKGWVKKESLWGLL
tara:strand:- start:116 stop:550 length:435 start_codon:yes stop_codon:yes gene_type:complete